MTNVLAILGFLLCVVSLWWAAVIWASIFDNLRAARKERTKNLLELVSPYGTPQNAREKDARVNQFVLFSGTNILAGAVAGLGASLLVQNGHLVTDSDPLPMLLFGVPALAVSTAGVVICIRLEKPMDRWVTPETLYNWLVQLDREHVSSAELEQAAAARTRFATETSVKPLNTVAEAHQLGIPSQHRIKADYYTYGGRKAIRHWNYQKRRLWHVAPPFIGGIGLLVLVIPLAVQRGSGFVFVALLAVSYTLALYWMSLCAGRAELLAVNLRYQRERELMRCCEAMIADLRSVPIQHTGNGKVTRVRIGRWVLYRRPR